MGRPSTIDAFLGITGHYIDKNWIRKKINLACSVFNTEHTGINIWKQIDEVLVDWDLLSKVGFFCIKDIGIAGFWNGIPSLFRYRPALKYRPVTDFYGIPAEG